MKLIIGLGNPGEKYELTRHNAGFLAIDEFLKDKQTIACQSKFDAQICEYHEDGEKVFLVKPQSYMNRSGQVVVELVNFYKLAPEKDILIIHDDKDLVFGEIKFTQSSGSAGHNGIKDIISQLGTQNFHRIRIGVESRPANSPIPTDVFVLQKFTEDELMELPNILTRTNQLITEFINKKN